VNNIPTILFKAEANEKVGGGHLHRCLSLAEVCNNLGFKVRFIFADSDNSYINKTKNLGYKIHFLQIKEELNPKTYIDLTPSHSLILFDTDNPAFYHGKLISTLRKNHIKTACFTISDKNEISTDILINPNIISHKHSYNTPRTTLKLLGPNYFVLNKHFSSVKYLKRRIEKPLNLLIFFGNADNQNITKFFIPIIIKSRQLFNEINIVIGSLNPDIEFIRKLIKLNNSRSINLHMNINTRSMINLYNKTDMAITSAGMAMWEMALFGISQLTIATSSREIEYSDYLSELGYIKKICDYNNLLNSDALVTLLHEIIESGELESLNTIKFQSIINPNGVKEICQSFYMAINN